MTRWRHAEDRNRALDTPARELATEVLAPAAMRVEASERVPPEHLDLLAAEGFYGLAGPREAGGLDVPSAPDLTTSGLATVV